MTKQFPQQFLFISLLLLLLSISCKKVYLEGDFDALKNTSTFLTKSVEPCYYHKQTNLIISPNNVNLHRLTLNNKNITHIAYKLFPKTPDQQFQIEELREKNVLLSYIPFGYSIVKNASDNEKAFLDVFIDQHEQLRHNLRAKSEFPERTLEGCCDTHDDYNENLPIIYAICPINLEIPSDIESIPCFGLTLMLPQDPTPIIEPSRNFVFETYDALLNKVIPLRKLKIRSEYNGLYYDSYTDSLGRFCASYTPLTLDLFSYLSTNVTCVLETPKWVISRNLETTPIHFNIGTIGDLWLDNHLSPNDTLHVCLSSSTTEYEIHRAADMYHYGSHPLRSSVSPLESGTIIHAMDSLHVNGYLGLTQASQKKINIYNAGAPARITISTVLHELGHVRHYFSADNYYSRKRIIRESFASFVGWYLGELYYYQRGYERSSGSYVPGEINSQHNQYWNETTSNKWYSPLCVDLIDAYNQYSSPSGYIDDRISMVPIDVIENLAKQSLNLEDSYTYLLSFVGSYFTLNDLDLMYSYYDWYNEETEE